MLNRLIKFGVLAVVALAVVGTVTAINMSSADTTDAHCGHECPVPVTQPAPVSGEGNTKGPTFNHRVTERHDRPEVKRFVFESEPNEVCVSRSVSIDLEAEAHATISSDQGNMPAVWDDSIGVHEASMSSKESATSHSSIETCVVTSVSAHITVTMGN